MITASQFFRYWYVWIVAAVLGIAAATNLDHGMQIQLFGLSVSMRIWQLFAAGALFLTLTGAFHLWMDHRRRGLPLWLKAAHLICTVGFFAFFFVYLQVLVSRSLADPHTYFGVGRPHYYEDGNVLVVGVALAFVASQLLLLGYGIRRLLRSQ